MTSMYNDFFRFPTLSYHLPPVVVVGGVMVCFAAASRRAQRGAPGRGAAARRSDAARAPGALPPQLARAEGLARLLSAPVRMILRNVGRHPVRAATSVIGIAAAVSMLILGTFFMDSMDVLMDQQFFVIQRQDLTVTFVLPASARALHEIGRLPGVVHAEPTRAVPARLRSAQHRASSRCRGSSRSRS